MENERGRQETTRDKGISSEETAEQCGNIRRQRMDGAEAGPVPGRAHTAGIPAPGRQRQEDQKFRANLAFTGHLKTAWAARRKEMRLVGSLGIPLSQSGPSLACKKSWVHPSLSMVVHGRVPSTECRGRRQRSSRLLVATRCLRLALATRARGEEGRERKLRSGCKQINYQ